MATAARWSRPFDAAHPLEGTPDFDQLNEHKDQATGPDSASFLRVLTSLSSSSSSWQSVPTTGSPLPTWKGCLVSIQGLVYLLGTPHSVTHNNSSPSSTSTSSSSSSNFYSATMPMMMMQLQVYDPLTSTWLNPPAPPDAPTVMGQDLACVAVQDRYLYVVTGFLLVSPTNTTTLPSLLPHMYVYDTWTASWSTRTALPIGRRRASTVAVWVPSSSSADPSSSSSCIYVSHGQLPNGTTVAWLDVYEVETDTWINPMNHHDNKTTTTTNSSADHRPTGSWPEAPHPRQAAGGVYFARPAHPTICIAGGRVRIPATRMRPSRERLVLATDCLDLETHTWKLMTAPALTVGRSQAAVGLTCDGTTMVLAGGIARTGKVLSSVVAWSGGADPSTASRLSSSSWQTWPALPQPRQGSGGLATWCYDPCHSNNNNPYDWLMMASGSSQPGDMGDTAPAGAFLNDTLMYRMNVSSSSAARLPTPCPSMSPSGRPTQRPTLGPTGRPSPSPSSQSPVPAGYPPILINCGSTSNFTDRAGRLWPADRYYNTGQSKTKNRKIANTSDDALYQSQRMQSSTTHIVYNIPLSSFSHHNNNKTSGPGCTQWNTTLHFAELYKNAPQQRVFDISIEGRTVRSGWDIWAAAGGSFTATTVSSLVVVTDGLLTVELIPVLDRPMLAAISAECILTPISNIPSSSPSSRPSRAPALGPPFEIRINAGGRAFVDPRGQAWQADTYYNTGYAYTNYSAKIGNTNNPVLYQSHRWDETDVAPLLAYQIPVPRAAQYQVILHFCELQPNLIGHRSFDVWVESWPAVTGLEVGQPFFAMNVTATVYVLDGMLSVRFMPIEGSDPMISGIEVKEQR